MKHIREMNSLHTFSRILLASGLVLAIATAAWCETKAGRIEPRIIQPFAAKVSNSIGDVLEIEVRSNTYWTLKNGPKAVSIEFPMPNAEIVTLEVERFEIVAPAARFESAGAGGQSSHAQPDVLTFRGQIAGDPSSHAFLALTATGGGNGYVTRGDGRRFVVSQASVPGSRIAPGTLTVHQEQHHADVPEFGEFCGLSHAIKFPAPARAGRSAPLLGGPQLAFVAVDADQYFVDLFPDDSAAQAYIVQLVAAVSDIYIRDFDVRLILSFVRTWPYGGEPFDSSSLGSFEEHWITSEDPTPYNLIHLMTGRRDTFFGGIAELADPCSGEAYAISSFLLGGFPNPVNGPHLGNWDVTVVAHEMGHNMGTLHTHDGYDPPIDECGSASIWARSDIMSYCHTRPGGLLNIDPRFHSRVQDVVAASVAAAGCLPFDCNDNNIDDAVDIAGPTSVDSNGNTVPDECEDCNNNGVLDSADIAGGAADVNINGIPDTCEANCNANTLPDEYEITNALVSDANGNLIPDGCEADCDASDVADHAEIAASGGSLDLDRNSVPDPCQDCNANGLIDYLDVDRESNIFVAELADFVREYHAESGVAIRNLAAGAVQNPYDVEFGPDRALYVGSFSNNRIVRIDVDAGTWSDFVPYVDTPAALTFGPNGHLFVSAFSTSCVQEFEGQTGAFIRLIVPPGSGGLTGPYGLTFGPNGNLFVASSNDTVKEYHGVSGAFVGNYVTPGAGGLSAPRGLAFTGDGRLLVTSHLTDSVMEYDANGQFTRLFGVPYAIERPWGIRVGPNGNVFVVRQGGAIRVLELDGVSGRYIRSFIRGDADLVSPTGLAFRPLSIHDCNTNRVPDDCDIADGTSTDVDGNGRPDECGCLPVPYGDIDHSGVVDVDDILCTLDGFASPQNCPGADIYPCGGNDLVDVDDILAILNAFSGNPLCPDGCI